MKLVFKTLSLKIMDHPINLEIINHNRDKLKIKEKPLRKNNTNKKVRILLKRLMTLMSMGHPILRKCVMIIFNR